VLSISTAYYFESPPAYNSIPKWISKILGLDKALEFKCATPIPRPEALSPPAPHSTPHSTPDFPPRSPPEALLSPSMQSYSSAKDICTQSIRRHRVRAGWLAFSTLIEELHSVYGDPENYPSNKVCEEIFNSLSEESIWLLAMLQQSAILELQV
jgi:hypothetical protein